MPTMISQSLVNNNEPVVGFADLQARLIAYASRIDEFRTSDEVLEALHATITKEPAVERSGSRAIPGQCHRSLE
jgi:hypothetical protein